MILVQYDHSMSMEMYYDFCGGDELPERKTCTTSKVNVVSFLLLQTISTIENTGMPNKAKTG